MHTKLTNTWDVAFLEGDTCNLQLSCLYPIQATCFGIVLHDGLLLHHLLLCVILMGGLFLCALYMLGGMLVAHNIWDTNSPSPCI
jgi:hypothetical protein